MTSKLKKTALTLIILVGLSLTSARVFGPAILEEKLNPLIDVDHSVISDEARTLHEKLTIMDWHADSLLWNRDFLKLSDYGKVDLPRLQKGNFSLQMLTTVTKSPEGQNYVENDAGSDTITKAAILQGWPIKTWDSLLERALYQSQKLSDFVATSDGQLSFITSTKDLSLHNQASKGTIGVLLGTEGAHPLEGKLSNIDVMFDAG
ncbi:MAG: membrane dipeptidase, partial [Kordiimonas sp.]